jgi:hypothetical protein
VKDAPLTFDAQGHNFFSYRLAISPLELDKLIKPASGLKEGVSQVKRERGAIALLPGFQVVQEPPNVSEEEIADLGFVVKRRVDAFATTQWVWS